MKSVKVLFLMAVLLLTPAVVFAQGENYEFSGNYLGNVSQPIKFLADRTIFLSAKIINPFAEVETLEVVLSDSSILYRDMTTNEVWKVDKLRRRTVASPEEYNLALGFTLDTGWIPYGSPVQIRIIFMASEGRIKAELPGKINMSYNDAGVIPGATLNTQVGYTGDQSAGKLHMEGGLIFQAKWRIVDIPVIGTIEGYWPYIPSIDLGFLCDTYYTPFLLGGTSAVCYDDIPKQPVGVSFDNIPCVKLTVGMEVSGTVKGTLKGNSVCGDIQYNYNKCIYSNSATVTVPVTISNSSCNTSIPTTNRYNESFNIDWGLSVGPTGGISTCLGWSYYITPISLAFTILKTSLPLDFNQPTPTLTIPGRMPTAASGCSATDNLCGKITVCWTDNSNNENSFNIYRNGSKAGSVSANVTCWDDNTNSSGTYYIKSYNSCGEATQSNSDNGTRLSPPSSAPAGTYADKTSVRTNETYKISWGQVSGATSYYLSENSSWTDVGNITYKYYSKNDTGSYIYKVRARNGCGDGPVNNQILVKVSSSTPVAENEDNQQLPTQYTLSQNYPNPFNATTKLEFTLPKACQVRLDIYNVLGKRIRTLIDEYLSAGYKTVTWDGKDDNGNDVSTGIHFYRIKAGEFSQAKRMVLLK